MTSSGTKTAEFAHLFERLASRRVRSSDLDMPMEDLRSLSIPEALEPVIKSLSTIVGRSKCKTLGSRARTSAPDEESDEESVAKFPLGKKYPFTFKLMVHKLYRVDEWAKTVKEMLEKSKMEFKPLAEQDAVVEEDKVEQQRQNNDVALINKDKNAVHFQVGVSNGGGRRGSVVGRRECSQTVIFSGPKTVSGSAFPLLKSPGRGGQSKFRILKKRCTIGRRKLNGGQSYWENRRFMNP